jgi:hypothetical protein
MAFISNLCEDDSGAYYGYEKVIRGIFVALWPLFMARALYVALGKRLWAVLLSCKRRSVESAHKSEA